VLKGRFKPVLLKRQSVATGVWGEAGIGKSYKVTEFLKTLPCHSLSLHSTTPLPSLVTALPKPKKLALWAENNLNRLVKGEAVETPGILDALGALLAGLAPFVLHLEDLHETDQERLEFIQKLAQMVERSKGVGLIITSRNEPPQPFEGLRLEPLTREASDALLEKEVSATLPKEALLWIYDKAVGNPLYTLEYLRFLSRQGSLWNDGKRWYWRAPQGNTMPATVEALIEMLLAGVAQHPRLETALQAKALLPLATEDELWAKVAELSKKELEAAKLELRSRGLFKADAFAHPLYREVTLKNLPGATRRELARRALETLQDDPVKAALFLEDTGLEDERALELLKKAAGVARARKDETSAGRFLAKAVQYARGEEKGKLALEAAQSLEGVDVPLALTLTESAARHLSEPSEALYLQALLLAGQGEYDRMQRVVGQLPEAFRGNSTWTAKQIHLLYLAGRDEERIAFWESHPEAQETCDGATAHFVAWGYINTGQPALAAALIERSLATTTLSALDKANLLEARATLSFYGGAYHQAEVYFSEALGLRQSLDFAPATANVLRNRSMSRLQQGRFRESLADFEQALAIYSETGKSLYYAETLIMMSHALLELGDYEQTEAVLLEALELFRRAEPHPNLVAALVQLAALYLAWGTQTHSYLALKYAREVERVAANFAVNSRLMAVSALAHVEPKPQRALAYANEALELATDLNILEAIVNSHYARGLALLALRQKDEAKEAFTLACQLAEEHGLVLEANKYGLELDRLTNDLESARKRVRWFEERGLLNSVNIAKRYFPVLAEATKPDKSASKGLPRLNVLGAMQISHDGRASLVRGRKRQEFVALLLEARLAGRSEVGRLGLLDTLYPNENELKALQNLKNLIHSLRSSFGEQAILTTNTGYGLGAIESDAEAFLETGDTRLWRGTYLKDIETRGRENVGDSLYLALFEKAKAMLETDSQEAGRVARFLLEADPYNVSYLTLNLQTLRARDNYRTLKQIYAEARERFSEVGEHLPETWLDFLGLTDKTLSNLPQN
jgi:tetratricopeptide (TPR) repeat protein